MCLDSRGTCQFAILVKIKLERYFEVDIKNCCVFGQCLNRLISFRALMQDPRFELLVDEQFHSFCLTKKMTKGMRWFLVDPHIAC